MITALAAILAIPLSMWAMSAMMAKVLEKQMALLAEFIKENQMVGGQPVSLLMKEREIQAATAAKEMQQQLDMARAKIQHTAQLAKLKSRVRAEPSDSEKAMGN